MSAHKKYEAIIAAKVSEWDGAGKDLNPTWITHEICQMYEAALVAGDDGSDFWRHFTYKACRQETGRFIAKHYGDESDGPEAEQQCFPGFDFVQRRYIVERNGDEVAVLTETMTDDELDAKERELRRRGQSCLAHADELARFKHLRQSSDALAG